MNWYKEIKLADSPIVVEDEDCYDYTMIGHPGARPEYTFLWMIDNNYKFHVTGLFEHHRHDFWPKYIYLENKNELIASGRYDKYRDITSMMLECEARKLETRRKEYVRRQVEKILDKYFNNPEIIFFK